MPKRPRAADEPADAAPAADDAVLAIRHRGKRKNIPPAGLEAQGRVEEAPRLRYAYNPHLPPVLRLADDPAAADRLPALLATARERALSADEAAILAQALRRHEPWLEWADDQFSIEVEGMDVYDPVSNSLFPTSRDRIAAWFVDTDYDGRTFCICQAFFPDRKKWEKLARALGDRGVVDEGRFDALAGFESLPFARPDRLPARAPWRVGVKVIDPRGNEGLRVLTMPE